MKVFDIPFLFKFLKFVLIKVIFHPLSESQVDLYYYKVFYLNLKDNWSIYSFISNNQTKI